jgi:hypothetical protein
MPKNDIWTPAIASLGRKFRARACADEGKDAGWDRRLYLPRVLPIAPEEIDDPTREAAQRIVRKLAAALRSERSRGRAGHWTYDLNRHVALIRAWKAERRRLVQLAGADRVTTRNVGK